MPSQGKVCTFLGCPSRSKKNPEKKFYPFAKPWIDMEKCLRWIAATGRKDLPVEYINKERYVCGDHFVNNGPSVENPDPLPYQEVRFCGDHFINKGPSVENPDPLPYQESRVCGDHFMNNSPSVENPDPLPYQEGRVCGYHFMYNGPSVEDPDPLQYQEDCVDDPPKVEESITNPEVKESLVMRPHVGYDLSPPRKVAIVIKKKLLAPKKSFRQQTSIISVAAKNNETMQASTSEVHLNTSEPVSENIRCLNRNLVAAENMETIESSKSVFHHNTPEPVPGHSYSHSRTLLHDFVMDIEENKSNGHEGISPLLDVLFHDTLTDDTESICVVEKDGKRSIPTQTWSRWSFREMVACATSKSKGVQIMSTSTDCDDSEEDEESGIPNTVQKGTKNRTVYISFESITSDDDFEYLSGMTRENFDVLYEFLGGDEVCSRLKYEAESGTPKVIRVNRLSLKCRLFITLCRLRRGFTERELAIFCGCSVSLVSRILNTWINFLYIKLQPLQEHMFQDQRSQRLNMPQRFRSFKGLRVAIDCTEIKIETLSNFQQQGNAQSSYKHSNTVKYLVGVNAHGAVCYVSEAFEGSMSDKEVFLQSSMYNMLQPGDVVMADRGFDITEDLDKIKVKLVIPSYLKERDYLTAEEEIWSKKIARARIFVENAIGRLKMWRILNSTFPQSTLPLVSQMMFVCACLSNFQPPLL